MTAVLSTCPAGEGVTSRTLALREITAAEELDAVSAEALVRAMAVPGGTAAADELTLSELDMAAVAIYRALYGEAVECHVPCRACDRRFETGVEIGDWLADIAASGPAVVRTGANAFEVPGCAMLRFRLPGPRDLAGSDAAALGRRCLVAGDPEDPRLEAAMARAGPLLDDDIAADCPHCGAPQSFRMRFDGYLMAVLARERPIVLREMHHIAATYHWPRAEILSLPRSVRREHVRLILSERSVAARASWR